MGSLDDFLRGLLDDGRAVLREPPGTDAEDLARASDRLVGAFAIHALDVAGPPIPFEPGTAVAIAAWFHRACWFLADRSAPAEDMERALALGLAPRTAGDHLSADVVLRLAPPLLRRALARDPGDRLAAVLMRTLIRWPLSGVLAGLDDGPGDPGDLGGHPGLGLLYAERFALRPREAWLPPSGPIRERVEWLKTLQELGVPGG
ncbi:hypothetical protein TA3x_001031 [Tundrisphaera sp. TA3]|uniref:hypothetical protein n=1 Tax=Tundrisphaera sp. TA3 TaxID=3435775 RepID=UPI003EBA9004